MYHMGPNRSFGLTLAAGCAILGMLAYRGGRGSDVVWGLLAAVFLLTAVAVPRVLAPARRGWVKLGGVLGKVMNPLILGVVFAVVFVPVGGLMRLLRRDAMTRKLDPAAVSYWIKRTDDTATAESLKEQF
jgi:hypothetical protein